MVGLGRVELPTSPLSGVRSSQLSYRPVWDPLSEKLKDPEARGLAAKLLDYQNFFEDRLNVHTGVAGTDYRANRARKERLECAPSTRLGNPSSGVRRELLDRSRDHGTFSLRKEVIQPQVLLRLPCYDFTPIMSYTLDGCFLAVSPPASSAAHFRDVTGGVYKARERIHRSVLICDY